VRFQSLSLSIYVGSREFDSHRRGTIRSLYLVSIWVGGGRERTGIVLQPPVSFTRERDASSLVQEE
jgi:hypothetical protein